jgi:hypothetical protein
MFGLRYDLNKSLTFAVTSSFLFDEGRLERSSLYRCAPSLKRQNHSKTCLRLIAASRKEVLMFSEIQYVQSKYNNLIYLFTMQSANTAIIRLFTRIKIKTSTFVPIQLGVFYFLSL